MYLRSSSPLLRSTLSLVVGASAIVWAGLAQAACLSEAQQLPPQAVNAFLANPGQIMQQFPKGGGRGGVRRAARGPPGLAPRAAGALRRGWPEAAKKRGSSPPRRQSGGGAERALPRPRYRAVSARDRLPAAVSCCGKP